MDDFPWLFYIPRGNVIRFFFQLGFFRTSLLNQSDHLNLSDNIANTTHITVTIQNLTAILLS